MSRKVVFGLMSVLFLASCARQPPSGLAVAPGFIMGLVQGFLMIPSLIGSIWWDVRIYPVPNNGI